MNINLVIMFFGNECKLNGTFYFSPFFSLQKCSGIFSLLARLSFILANG